MRHRAKAHSKHRLLDRSSEDTQNTARAASSIRDLARSESRSPRNDDVRIFMFNVPPPPPAPERGSIPRSRSFALCGKRAPIDRDARKNVLKQDRARGRSIYCGLSCVQKDDHSGSRALCGQFCGSNTPVLED